MIGVLNILLNTAAVTARVAARIYPIERKQSAGLPAITIDITGIEPNATKSGVSALDEQQITVVSYADTYDGCRLLADDCRAALDRISGTYNGEVIQQIDFLEQFIDKEEINNKKVYYIEQNYKVRIEI